MADISVYLNEILKATYGEEVRSSIYNAINLINNVGEKVITLGTSVTSTSSSVSGYYKNSLYLNINTFDLWQCTGTNWANVGNLKGAKGDQGAKGDKGDQGVQGIQGIQGIQGVKGDRGEKGDQGERGIQGYSITEVSRTSQSGLVDIYTIKNEANEIVGTISITNGAKGETGLKGDPGVSPTITVNKNYRCQRN